MAEPPSPNTRTSPDASLARLFARPFCLAQPAVQAVPFVFASPHSGRNYPDSLAAASRLDALTLRRSEDAFVDELFAAAPELGAPLLTAEFPRAFVDANRAPAELDAGMFASALAVPVDPPSPRVAAGLGVIPRIVRDGADIYRAPLAPQEASDRLEQLYRPYHTALALLVQGTIARFGVAVVVDCHSMPSSLNGPDIVLGDRYGASAAPALSQLAQEAFRREGFSVARNIPYAGGHTTSLYGHPGQGCHALQLEINRGLYMNEDRITRRESFERVKLRLTAAMLRLVAVPTALLGRTAALPDAAE